MKRRNILWLVTISIIVLGLSLTSFFGIYASIKTINNWMIGNDPSDPYFMLSIAIIIESIGFITYSIGGLYLYTYIIKHNISYIDITVNEHNESDINKAIWRFKIGLYILFGLLLSVYIGSFVCSINKWKELFQNYFSLWTTYPIPIIMFMYGIYYLAFNVLPYWFCANDANDLFLKRMYYYAGLAIITIIISVLTIILINNSVKNFSSYFGNESYLQAQPLNVYLLIKMITWMLITLLVPITFALSYKEEIKANIEFKKNQEQYDQAQAYKYDQLKEKEEDRRRITHD